MILNIAEFLGQTICITVNLLRESRAYHGLEVFMFNDTFKLFIPRTFILFILADFAEVFNDLGKKLIMLAEKLRNVITADKKA